MISRSQNVADLAVRLRVKGRLDLFTGRSINLDPAESAAPGLEALQLLPRCLFDSTHASIIAPIHHRFIAFEFVQHIRQPGLMFYLIELLSCWLA